MRFFQEFGVQPLLLAGQIVNFLILLFVLKRIFYKPILDHLEKRRQKIKKGIEQAAAADKILEQAQTEYINRIAKAKKEAEQIATDAELQAQKIIAEAHDRARQEMRDAIQEAEEKIKNQKQKMKEEVREELAEIVSIALERIAGDIIGKNKMKQKKYMDRALKNLYTNR